MSRSRLTTTQRGLGHLHQQRRAALLPAALGTPCPGPSFGPRSRRCTGLMVDPKRMHLDHTVARALGGKHGDRIICAPCNTSSGARLGNALRRARTQRRRAQSRAW